jgi:hypothetical protein
VKQAKVAVKEGLHLYGNGQGQMQMENSQQFLGHAVDPFIGPDFATAGAKAGLARERHQPFLIAVGADIAGKTIVGIAAANHLFDHFLDVGPLVSRNLFPAVVPPPLPVVVEDLAKAIATVFRRRIKQQYSRCPISGDDQHALAGVGETCIIVAT